MRSNLVKISFILSLSLFSSGCSYVFLTKPERIHTQDPNCTTSALAPGFDTLFSMTSTGGTVYSSVALAEAGRLGAVVQVRHHRPPGRHFKRRTGRTPAAYRAG